MENENPALLAEAPKVFQNTHDSKLAVHNKNQYFTYSSPFNILEISPKIQHQREMKV